MASETIPSPVLAVDLVEMAAQRANGGGAQAWPRSKPGLGEEASARQWW